MATRFIGACIIAGLLATGIASGKDVGVEQLVAQADAALRKDAGKSAAGSSVIFAAADQLAKVGRLAEAEHYYAVGLKAAPTDYEHHMAYTDLLIRQNRKPAAVAEANVILQESENQALIIRAQETAGISKPAIPPLGELPGGKPVLVLVPIGDVDVQLLADEQKKLHDELGVEVLLREVPVNVLDSDRDPRELQADALRDAWNTARIAKPDDFAVALRDAGMTLDDLKDNAKVFRFSIDFDRKIGREDLAVGLESLLKRGAQWSAEKMLHSFAVAVRPFTKANVGFIGVTKDDIFADATNFVFADHQNANGIISYRRFLAGSYGQPDQRARLARRLHLQALGVAGYVFGMDACTDATCPRHPSAGLADHDAKSDRLCKDCRKGFESILAMPQIVVTPKVAHVVESWIAQVHADPKTAYLHISKADKDVLTFELHEGNKPGYLVESGGVHVLIDHAIAADVGPATIDDDETPTGRWLLMIPKDKPRAEGRKIFILAERKP